MSAKRPRGPRPVAQPIESLRSRLVPPTLLAQVQERWARAVGPRVAAEALPVAEREGIVSVSCRSSAWASELSLLSTDLLERLNQELTEGARVRGLRFTTGPQ
jgi:predicted nucleic acid-binding Zn ribbon protein